MVSGTLNRFLNYQHVLLYNYRISHLKSDWLASCIIFLPFLIFTNFPATLRLNTPIFYQSLPNKPTSTINPNYINIRPSSASPLISITLTHPNNIPLRQANLPSPLLPHDALLMCSLSLRIEEQGLQGAWGRGRVMLEDD